MTSITVLLNELIADIPQGYYAACDFLSRYSVDDQCALISAIIIGTAHVNADRFITEDAETWGHFSALSPFSRYLHTGEGPDWLIKPEEFADIISRKAMNLSMYCKAFLRCARNSGYDLQSF